MLACLLCAAAGYGAAPAAAATIWAVGDGAVPEPYDEEVAQRIQADGPFDRFLYLGDVYETGTAEEYRTNYDPAFGRFKAFSSPTPGNHEWDNRGQGYDPYWGSLAPRNGGHWYSFDLAGWHIVSLNSEEDASEGSAQVAWLRADLARYDGTCTLAFMHKPRYSAQADSGGHPELEPAWSSLVGRAVAVLAGHHHNYQRLAPERGLVQFVVGTGGRRRYNVNEADPRLQASSDQVFGALRLRLASGTATYDFLTSSGEGLDSGSLGCRPHSSAPLRPPTATPEPGAGLPLVAPRVRISHPRSGRRYSRRLRRFRGTLRGADAPVRLTVVHKARCGSAERRRSGSRLCTRRYSFLARGRERWSLTFARGLPAGLYTLTARVQPDGARSTSARVRFRVR